MKTKSLELKEDNSKIIARYKEAMCEQMELTDNQKDKIKKRLKSELECHESDTAELQVRLERWNNLMENIVEDTDTPWEGASNVHIPVVAIYCKVYHSIERRSILGSGKIWYAVANDDVIKGKIASIEEYSNYKAFNEWNTAEFLSDVFWTTNRDGLGIGEFSYALDTEAVEDIIHITNSEEFLQEFPSAEESGIDEQEWEELRSQAERASEEEPLEIPIKYTDIKYMGPRAEVIERADFVILPATAISIERRHARGYGKRFRVRKGEIKRMAKELEWDKDEVSNLLTKKKKGSDTTSYQKSKEWASGLSRTKNDEYELFSLTYWVDIDNDGQEEKMQFIYSLDTDSLLSHKPYNFRCDNYVLFRIEKRANQLDGYSVIGGIVDQNDEIDALHNQRINSRRITEVPTFMTKESLKKKYGDDEFRFYPGKNFWVETMEDMKQWTIQPVDLGTSMNEESNDWKICTLWAGVDPFTASGNAMPDDPNAPGNKTQMLINQSSMRMEDPLMELRQGVNKTGDICLSLEYQFGNPIMEYQSEKGMQTISKRFLRKGIKMHMVGITPALNSDMEFMKWYNYYKLLVAEPAIAKKAKRRIEALRIALRNGRIEGRDRILPTDEELDAEDREAQEMITTKAAQMMAQQQGELQKKAVLEQIETKTKANDLKLKVLEQGLKKKNMIRGQMNQTEEIANEQ